MTRVRSRFFIIGTLVLMVLLAGYIVLQALVISRATSTVKIGFQGDAQALAQPLKSATKPNGVNVEIHTVSDVAEGESEVRAGTLDALISGDAAAPDVAVKDRLDATVQVALDEIVKGVALHRALTAGGANASAIEGQFATATPKIHLLDPKATQRAQRTVVGIFVAVLLYVALMIYGQIVASGVIEEKANRIIEILLSTVRPRQLLLGKVVGIGLMGFLQLFLLGVVAIIALNRTHVITVPSVGVTAVLGGLLWFVLGFVFFAMVYAAAGSLVSRQEDLGAVVAPISMLVVGTYLAFFWVVANPDNPIGIALSVIPPFSPILMPARMATGDATWWQATLAVVLMVLAIAGINGVAARIYSNSVLRIGSRVGFIQAWRGTT